MDTVCELPPGRKRDGDKGLRGPNCGYGSVIAQPAQDALFVVPEQAKAVALAAVRPKALAQLGPAESVRKVGLYGLRWAGLGIGKYCAVRD